MDIKQEQYIHSNLYWLGQITASQIKTHFQTSLPTAKRVFTAYKQKYPTWLEYNANKKHWHATEQFYQHNQAASLNQFFQQTNENILSSNPDQNLPCFEHLPLPNHYIAPDIFRSIYFAVINQQRVEANYISIRSADADGRIITPHSFVFDGLRWHVRAFDEKRQAFLDFNLSRFIEPVEPEGMAEQHALQAQDKQWNTMVDVVLVPDPRLNLAQQQCIEREYQMQNGKLTITCRAALVKYLLVRMRVDSVQQSTGEAQQIILEPNCRKTLLPYIPTN